MAATNKNKGQKAIEKTNSVLERLTVEYVAVGDLRPNAYNPNRQSDHDFELLLRSMREDGFTQPIVCQKDGTVDGEHRWRAGQALGMAEVPVVYVDMTPEQMRIATLRHNRARGSEDIELAASVLRDLAQLGALDYAQDSLLLDDVELQRLIDDVPAPDALAGEDFSGAWEPTESEGGRDAEENAGLTASGSSETVVTHAPGGGFQSQAASAEAIEASRKRERDLALAKTAEEKDRINAEAQSFHRLMLLFHGDQAVLVQTVLGGKAADKLVDVLREFVENHPEDEGVIAYAGLAQGGEGHDSTDGGSTQSGAEA